MPHSIWKGAISFGLVHVPVALYPASTDIGIDFDWLDKRSMDPVGYKRVNKKTGKEVTKENIVKGVQVDGGHYVVISEDEIRAAYPKTTQTIEIEAFVHAAEIPFTQLEKPYYLEPVAKGEKVYALLREAMLAAGVVGIARVVMHTKEYLAALIPTGPALMLNTLRWAAEIRPAGDITLPAAGKSALKDAELKMAKQLIDSMTQTWAPDAYADRFTKAIHALVAKRVAAGDTETVEPMEDAAPEAASNVVDLTALLKQSLGKKTLIAKAPARPAPKKGPAAKKPARKRA
ncbi:MAG TPA: Ku protein [Burkholderiaceae bacterium]|nr:Ku protein [Burkholderiaceae bacterium]